LAGFLGPVFSSIYGNSLLHQCGAWRYPDQMSENIPVHINGDEKQVPAALSLRGLCLHLGLKPEKVAIERNLEIAPRSQHDAIYLEAGDRLEIVHFVGGG
jgi:thiamine biosynthesis protein ThiS